MKKNREQYDTNRSMKRKPKRNKGWCDFCDSAIVEGGQKCHACGHRQISKRNKKEKI